MKKADTWMPFYVADYLRDTMHLTTEMHGAYMLLLMAAWTRGGVLPNDDLQLAGISKMSPSQWRKAKAVLLPFFQVVGSDLVQKRLAAESQKAQRLSDTRRETGSRGGRPRKQTESNEKPIGIASGNQTGLQTETPSPSPSSEPDGSSLSDADASSVAKATEPWAKDEDFAKAWDACTVDGRRRSSRAKAWLEWKRARKWAAGADLAAAMVRYVDGDADVKRGTGGPGFHIWLRDRKWEHWLTVEAPVRAVFAGPADLRAAVVDAAGDEDFAVAYLDPCGWQEVPTRALIAHNSYAADMLRRTAGRILAERGIEVLTLTGRAVA